MENFGEYEIQGEPEKKEKALIWQAAIGLQATDGLQVSQYLIELAKDNIEGNKTIYDVKESIQTYYKLQNNRDDNSRTREADEVSARIIEILSEKTFWFNPEEYIGIHKRLFENVDGLGDIAGKIRTNNLSKKEWVLDNDSVLYLTGQHLRQALAYDFDQEKKFVYKGLKINEQIERIAEFIKGIWQIHPFYEGNTRTTAVFLVKYLQSKDFNPDWQIFKDNSWYFRNALVRANYESFRKGIFKTNDFLVKFLGNLVLGENNILKNRYLRIDALDTDVGANVGDIGINVGINVGIKESILLALKSNKQHTGQSLADLIGVTKRTVERSINELKSCGKIKRVGSNKTGYWELI